MILWFALISSRQHSVIGIEEDELTKWALSVEVNLCPHTCILHFCSLGFQTRIKGFHSDFSVLDIFTKYITIENPPSAGVVKMLLLSLMKACMHHTKQVDKSWFWLK
ncbi:hypothetical protein FRX31_024707 [Thalictrum thalictroides]|uniref:Uncharacterized protein n=1 Tax=Thalictrum thalictroides TaxID=46969 RepID=A0A7J6VKQ4_THATH|nr:hypothetical protein FRX31_024707 [Thalictrum thalictroides]